MSGRPVRAAASFERNLGDLRRFVDDVLESPTLFDRLLDDLEELIGLLEEFPELGDDLLQRKPGTVEAREAARTLRDRLFPGESVREHVRGDHLVLYLTGPEGTTLLAIRHHCQLSYDLSRLWPPPR